MIALTKSQECLLLEHFGEPLKLTKEVTTDVILDVDHLCRVGLLHLESARPFINAFVGQNHQLNAQHSVIAASEWLREIVLDDKVALLATLTPAGILEMIERKPRTIRHLWYSRCDEVFQALIDKCSTIHSLSLDRLPKYLTHDNDVYRKAAAFRFLTLEDNE